MLQRDSFTGFADVTLNLFCIFSAVGFKGFFILIKPICFVFSVIFEYVVMDVLFYIDAVADVATKLYFRICPVVWGKNVGFFDEVSAFAGFFPSFEWILDEHLICAF